MSGSGKSTLAEFIKSSFQNDELRVEIVDGDTIRNKDTKKLGYSFNDVKLNNLRIAKICLDLKDSGFNLVLVPVISPYDEVRSLTKAFLSPHYHLVHLDANIDSLRQRDTKGLYRASDEGYIDNLIGYSKSNPYEIPANPDLVINTNSNSSLEYSKELLLGFVKSISI